MTRDAVMVGGWPAWVVFISVGTGTSFQQLSFKMWGTVPFDILTHFASYALLAYLTAVWWARQPKNKFLRRHAMTGAVLFAALIGLGLEVVQLFIPGRYYAQADVIANAAGAVTGGLVFRCVVGNVYRF